MERWQLPSLMTRLIRDHHEPTAQGRTPAERSPLRVMRLGEAPANVMACHHVIRHQTLDRLMAEYVDRAALCRECISESIAQTSRSCELFSLPVPSEESLQRLLKAVNVSRSALVQPA